MDNFHENKGDLTGFPKGQRPFGRGLGNLQKNTLGRVGGTRALRLPFLRVLKATGMDDSEVVRG